MTAVGHHPCEHQKEKDRDEHRHTQAVRIRRFAFKRLRNQVRERDGRQQTAGNRQQFLRHARQPSVRQHDGHAERQHAREHVSAENFKKNIHLPQKSVRLRAPPKVRSFYSPFRRILPADPAI